MADSGVEVSEEEFKSLCSKLEYNDILRNPDSYNNEYCVLEGKVNQIIEGLFGSYTIYISDNDGNQWGCLYYYKDGESHLLENDSVTVYGKCNGTETTTTVIGKQVTFPYVEIEYIN